MRTTASIATVTHNVRLRRRPTPPPDEKPYLVTIHAPGDQHHTFRMGPGDAIGVGAIRIDIAPDGGIHASSIESARVVTKLEVVDTSEGDNPHLAAEVRKQLLKHRQRSGQRR